MSQALFKSKDYITKKYLEWLVLTMCDTNV